MTHQHLSQDSVILAVAISLELKMELFNPKNWVLFEFQIEQIILN